MVLSEKDIETLRRAKQDRRKQSSLVACREWIEQSRDYHERLAEMREPSADRLKEVFNF